MTKTGKLAVMGDIDSVLAFKAVGAETFEADAADAKSVLRGLVKKGEYAIIFVTEQLAAAIPDALEEYKSITYPCVIPIPSCLGSNGYGMASIKKDVEKAIGADILGD